MNYKDWKKLEEQNCQILDKIDFLPYIKKYDNLRELRYAIEDDYDNTELTNNDILYGCTFSCLDEYDITKYIERKYHIVYHEQTEIYYVRGEVEVDENALD